MNNTKTIRPPNGREIGDGQPCFVVAEIGQNNTKTIRLPNGREIGDGQPCFVVAEIGQNHNGDVYTAVRLWMAARQAGVDAVKFTKRHIPSELTAAAHRKPHEGSHSFGRTYGEHREALELSIRELLHLKDRVRYNEWPEVFFLTACDIHSVNELEKHIDPPIYKIASRDIDNLPLIERIAATKKPVFLSTGFGDIDQIYKALDEIRRVHNQIVLLHCTSRYPTAEEDVWLDSMWWMRRAFDVPIGLSDHTPGIVAAQTAAARGAAIVEKHLTLSRAMKGTDHGASLEPDGMRRLVKNIRSAERMSFVPAPEPGELYERFSPPPPEETRKKLGRSLVTREKIEKGRVIEQKDLCLKSPGDGVPWPRRHEIVGTKARRTIPADVTVQRSDVARATAARRENG